MTDPEMYALENKFPVQGIEIKAKGLFYIFDGEMKGIDIAGAMGKTGLTIEQAKAVCQELPEVLKWME